MSEGKEQTLRARLADLRRLIPWSGAAIPGLKSGSLGLVLGRGPSSGIPAFWRGIRPLLHFEEDSARLERSDGMPRVDRYLNGLDRPSRFKSDTLLHLAGVIEDQEHRRTTEEDKDLPRRRFGMPVRPDVRARLDGHTKPLDRIFEDWVEIVVSPFSRGSGGLCCQFVKELAIDLLQGRPLLFGTNGTSLLFFHGFPSFRQVAIECSATLLTGRTPF